MRTPDLIAPISAQLQSLLVVADVSKQYVVGPLVLNHISHTFRPGTATGIVGPNGSGKSTLLRILSALSRPTTGSVTFGDQDIHGHPHQYLAFVGIVHDQPDLPGFLTAVETLEWISRERGRWSDSAPARQAALLDAVLLDDRRNQLVGTYSAGMLRKTQVAAALVGQPKVLLLDEPFRGLDTEATVAVLGLLRAFKDAGGIVVLSSHRADLLAELGGEALRLGAAARPA